MLASISVAGLLLIGAPGRALAQASPVRPWAASDATPSFKIVKGTLVSPATATTDYAALGTSTTDGLCADYSGNQYICPSGSRPRAPEVKELARALRNDPDLIYEYIRNSIETEFIFGAHKGPLGAIIDKSATAFDQAELMVQLLREAGFTARYRYGQISLTGTQWTDWTGLTDATASSSFLAAGGIPAVVSSSSGTVTGVVMSHIWVEAQIGGVWYQFDPAFKPHTVKPGIDVRAGMSMTAGSAYSSAQTGSTHNADGRTVSGFSKAGLEGVLQTQVGNLRTRLSLSDMQGAGLKDVIGGLEIQPAVRPSGGWRQTSLSYVTSSTTWTEVLDAYRAKITLTATGTSGALTASFFADEVYGRRLEMHNLQEGRVLVLDGVVLRSWFSVNDSGTGQTSLTLSVTHPFATSTGAFANSSVTRPFDPFGFPLSIVVGWGVTSPALASKWSEEQGADRETIDRASGSPTATSSPFPGSSPTDLQHMRLGPAWLGQFSAAAQIHQELAAARFTHLHSIGFVYGIYNVTDAGSQADTADILDISTVGALTATSSATASRRSPAIHALAATAATLEGSVVEQAADAPDSASTARRFAWGNNPDSQAGVAGARNFYRIDGGVTRPSSSSFTDDSAYARYVTGITTVNAPSPGGVDFRVNLLSALDAYTTAGFEITTSMEAALGPGVIAGSTEPPGTGAVNPLPSTQRGGAFVAVKYDGSEPVEIAHVVTNYYTVAKGGVAGQLPNVKPKDTADLLKDKFVDRSTILGVDLQGGRAGYTSPVLASVGQGEFPYKLEETLTIRGQGFGGRASQWMGNYDPDLHVKSYPGRNPSRAVDGLVSSFDGAAELSNSGLEAMGRTRADAAVGTLVGFATMQDVYAGSSKEDRDIIGLMVSDWWGRQLLQNVATISQGGQAEQYVLVDETSGVRTYRPKTGPAKVTVSGSRTAVRLTPNSSATGYPWIANRIYVDSSLTISWTDGHGASKAYQYWAVEPMPGATQIGRYRGFRLNTWSFASGPLLTLNYPTQSDSNGQPAAVPTSVSSNVGPTLTLSTVPATFLKAQWSSSTSPPSTDAACPSWASNYALYGSSSFGTFNLTDPAGGVTRVKFRLPVSRTVNQRPVDSCLIEEVYTPVETAKSTPAASLAYVYDSLGRIKEARDGVAIQTPTARGPHLFFIADGYRGERQDPQTPTAGRYTVETLPAGGLTVGSTAAASMTRNIDEVGRTVVTLYDGRGRVLSRTFPEGNKELFTYDARDNITLLTMVPKAGSSLANTTVSATWDTSWNKPLTVTDQRGFTTTYTYFGSGSGTSLIQSILQPHPTTGAATGGPYWTYTYNAYGQMLTATDPTGMVTAFTYDSSSHYPTSFTTDYGSGRLNLRTCLKSDAQGNVVSQSDPRTGTCP